MALPGPARLSVQALTWLVKAERIGEPHPVLAPAAMWYPPDEQDELHATAREEIAELGWYDRRNRLEIEVSVALALVCRAEAEFFGWITHRQRTVGVLAAGIGRHGLLAVRDGDSVWLWHIGRSVLAERLIDQTPDVSGGAGKPVTVSLAEVRRSVRGQRLTEAAVQVGPAAVAVRRVQQFVALPRTGGGELYTAIRDGMGRYRISDPLRYADTERGRYLTLALGRDQNLVAPASRTELLARLKELRRRLSN